MVFIKRVVAVGAVFLTPAFAFLSPAHQLAKPVVLSLSGTSHNSRHRYISDDDGSNSDLSQGVAAAQDVKCFITQRCLQSFMYLLSTTRDLHTCSWLDMVVQPITVNLYWEEEEDDYKPGAEDTFRENDKKLGSKLLTYHGLSAMNTTLYPEWDSFFHTLLEEPDTVLKIKTPKELGLRAYSSFDIDIEPARLCSRILSVREQIAREMMDDCKAINSMGHFIISSYQQNSRDRTDRRSDDGKLPKAFESPSTLYTTFDHRDDEACAPSPLCKSNFDLLYSLLTQTAIVELLTSEDGVIVGEDVTQNQACTWYLHNFYHERLPSHFVGSQWHGKSDSFIEELILSSPMLVQRPDSQDVSEKQASEKPPSLTNTLEIEPLRIAEQVLLKRDAIALEWMDVMRGVPSDHTEIRRMQLTRLTGIPKTDDVFCDEFQ